MKYSLLLILLFKCTVGITQITTNCVTWINGPLPNQDVVNAADNLCNAHLISNVIDVQSLNNFRVVDAALTTLNALYSGNVPNSLPSDNFPTFFGDIDNLPFQQLQAIKAMCYLEYGDGRPCLSRDYTEVNPYQLISPGNILRMLYEAWQIPPDTLGYNVFNLSSSSFLSNISDNDVNYGYIKLAYEQGILNNYIVNGTLPQQNINAGQFYLVALNNIYNTYRNIPSISAKSFYTPNNVQLNNSGVSTDMSRGVFKTYEQSSFNIPSGGIGLNFFLSYHSDWLDIPQLGFGLSNDIYVQNSGYIDERAKELNSPLSGCVCSHSYRINKCTFGKNITVANWFELKPAFSYIHTSGPLYSNEETNNVAASITPRLKINDQFWLPVTIKYDIKDPQLFGFISVEYSLK